MNKISVCVVDRASGGVVLNEVQSDDVLSLLMGIDSDVTRKVSCSGKECRVGRFSNAKVFVYGFSSNKDFLNSGKMFSSHLRYFVDGYDTFVTHLKRVEEREVAQSRRLIHNLRSLNAKIMQEIYYIVLQDRLIGSGSRVLDYIESEVQNNTRDVAKAILSILKCGAAQKAEFSVFGKMNGDAVSLSKQFHNIHQVVMNVFYLFFQEFSDRSVRCDVERTVLNGFFDYESIQVCLYHLVENASKYVKVGSDLKVVFSSQDNKILVTFDMVSLFVCPDEEQNIFEEGFSGKYSKEKGLNGAGIGLSISKKMARMNGASLTFIAGARENGHGEYAHNKFILCLPSVGGGI